MLCLSLYLLLYRLLLLDIYNKMGKKKKKFKKGHKKINKYEEFSKVDEEEKRAKERFTKT